MTGREALFPGAFDPLTNGHFDLVIRGCGIFDRVVVAVAESKAKVTLLPWQLRVDLARQAFSTCHKVEVVSFGGLLADYARAGKIHYILRGLRSLGDYAYETSMLFMNRHIDDSLETVFLAASTSDFFISSSQVREIASLGSDISHFVPPKIARRVSDFIMQERERESV